MNAENIVLFLNRELKVIKPTLPDELPPASDFRDWNLDSLDLVEFVARIERRFKILIPDEDLPQFVTLEATVRYIESRVRS